MSVVANRVRRGRYLDSVALMRIARSVAAIPGIQAAALMIGTPANKAVLERSGLLGASADDVVANDLVIAIRGVDEPSVAQALDRAEALLDQPLPPADTRALAHAQRFNSALERIDGANLALISIPGAFAAREAHRALDAGLNVVLFSDNVPLGDEIALKRHARDRGLLMMGPDCGTCLIQGVPIAFANAVPRGGVGIVSASGTGLQEVASLIARAGGGIAHGIGVGGRDLSAEVEGLSTLMAIDALEREPQVERIALISKPPSAAVAERVLARIHASNKPFVVCFLGSRERALPANAASVGTLRAVAERCLGHSIAADWLSATLRGRASARGRIRGLFCGGTLCAEAQVIALEAGLEISSNVPVPGARAYAGDRPAEHVMLDLGDDEYTRGQPHPMIEPEVRSDLIERALSDPHVAVLLLDVVIGYGAHDDPAGVAAQAIARSPRRNAQIIASVTGTEQDRQCYSAQRRTLERAGAIVAPSNAHAAELAARLVTMRSA